MSLTASVFEAAKDNYWRFAVAANLLWQLAPQFSRLPIFDSPWSLVIPAAATFAAAYFSDDHVGLKAALLVLLMATCGFLIEVVNQSSGAPTDFPGRWGAIIVFFGWTIVGALIVCFGFGTAWLAKRLFRPS